MLSVAILDLGLGNVKSLEKICRKFIDVQIINGHSCWSQFDLVIFPGVGSFDAAVTAANKYSIKEKIISHLQKNNHFLGICVGMQVLFESSEEGMCDGLSLFKGHLKRFNKNSVVVPHMMWDKCEPHDFPFEINSVFYFTHSFALFEHGFNKFIDTQYESKFLSGFYENNVLGTQFHPEKSGSNGIKFFESYFNYLKKVRS